MVAQPNFDKLLAYGPRNGVVCHFVNKIITGKKRMPGLYQSPPDRKDMRKQGIYPNISVSGFIITRSGKVAVVADKEMTRATLPSELENIEAACFCDSAIRTVYIPASVRAIQGMIFDCKVDMLLKYGAF